MFTPEGYYSQMSPYSSGNTGAQSMDTPGMSPLQMQFMTQGQMGYMPQAQFLTPSDYGAFRTIPVNTSNMTPNQTSTWFSDFMTVHRGNPLSAFGIGSPYSFFNTYNPTVNQNVYTSNAMRRMHDRSAAFSLEAGNFMVGSGVSALAGLAFGPLGLAAGLLMPDVATPFVDRIRETRGIQNATMSRIVGGPDVNKATGMGFSGQAARGIDKFIRKEASADLLFKEGDYRNLLNIGMDMGMFDFANSADAYKKQLKNLRDVVTGVMDVVGSADFKDILKQFKRMRDMGVNDPQFANMLRTENMFARIAGLSHEDMVNTYGQQGAAIYNQYGMDAYTGTMHNMANAANVTLLKRSGLIKASDLARLGGDSGLAQKMTENQAKVENKLMPWIAAAISNSSGTGVDQESLKKVMDSLNNGTFNPTMLKNMSKVDLGDVHKLSNFMSNKKEIYSQFMEGIEQDKTGWNYIKAMSGMGSMYLKDGTNYEKFMASVQAMGLDPEVEKARYKAVVMDSTRAAQIERQKVEEDRNKHEQYLSSRTFTNEIITGFRKALTGVGEFATDKLMPDYFKKSDERESRENYQTTTGGASSGAGAFKGAYTPDGRRAKNFNGGGNIKVDEGGHTKAMDAWSRIRAGETLDADTTQVLQRATYIHEAGGKTDIFDPSLYHHMYKTSTGAYKNEEKKLSKDEERRLGLTYQSTTRGPNQATSWWFDWTDNTSVIRRLADIANNKDDARHDAAIAAISHLTNGRITDPVAQADEMKKLFVRGEHSFVNSDQFRTNWLSLPGVNKDAANVLRDVYTDKSIDGYRQMVSATNKRVKGRARESFDALLQRQVGNEYMALLGNLSPEESAKFMAKMLGSVTAADINKMTDMELVDLIGRNVHAPAVDATHAGHHGAGMFKRVADFWALEYGNPTENNKKYEEKQKEAAAEKSLDESRKGKSVAEINVLEHGVMSKVDAAKAGREESIDRLSDIIGISDEDAVFFTDLTIENAENEAIKTAKAETLDDKTKEAMRINDVIRASKTFDSDKLREKLAKTEKMSLDEIMTSIGTKVKDVPGRLKDRLIKKWGMSEEEATRFVEAHGSDIEKEYYARNKEAADKKFHSNVEIIKSGWMSVDESLQDRLDEANRSLRDSGGVGSIMAKEFEEDKSNWGNQALTDYVVAIKKKANEIGTSNAGKGYSDKDADAIYNELSKYAVDVEHRDLLKEAVYNQSIRTLSNKDVMATLGLTGEAWEKRIKAAEEKVDADSISGYKDISDMIQKTGHGVSGLVDATQKVEAAHTRAFMDTKVSDIGLNMSLEDMRKDENKDTVLKQLEQIIKAGNDEEKKTAATLRDAIKADSIADAENLISESYWAKSGEMLSETGGGVDTGAPADAASYQVLHGNEALDRGSMNLDKAAMKLCELVGVQPMTPIITSGSPNDAPGTPNIGGSGKTPGEDTAGKLKTILRPGETGSRSQTRWGTSL